MPDYLHRPHSSIRFDRPMATRRRPWRRRLYAVWGFAAHVGLLLLAFLAVVAVFELLRVEL